MEKTMTRIHASMSIAMIVLANAAASAAERTVTLAVENMYCDTCPYIVKQSLAKVPGVEKVVISFERKTAIVTYDDQKTAPSALASATTDAGFPSRVIP
jgi:mercuric ion binding protein